MVFLLVLLILAGLFVGTTFATRFHRDHQATLGRRWFARAEAALAAQRPADAVVDLRTALVYSHNNRVYRLRLGQALAAAGQAKEAMAYLLTSWQEEPGNAEINVELARLAARSGDVDGAAVYYHNAIVGLWPGDPEERRRSTRFELARFLVAQGRHTAAQAELLGLEATLPDEASLHVRLADLLLGAGARPAARQAYERAAGFDPGNLEALAGAGRLAFDAGDYLAARKYLSAAVSAGAERGDLAETLQVANLVLRDDPFARGISSAERRARTIRNVAHASTRLTSCAKALPEERHRDAAVLGALGEHLRVLRKTATNAGLRRDPDAIDAAMGLVFEIESEVSKACGGETAADRALRLIGQRAGYGP